MLSVKFHWIPFSGLRGEAENISAHQRSGRPFYNSDRTKNTNLVEDFEILLPASFIEFRLAVSEGNAKMSQPIRGQGGHLIFSNRPEQNINLLETVEILLPVKFY